MVKHPYGPPTPHITQSKGPDTNLMKFYITEHSSNYGKSRFIPRAGKHIGTGYQSNFRPGVYYSRRLDELDNPTMGGMLTDNYVSVTKKDYLPSKGSRGNDPFSNRLYQTATSGFVKDIPVTVPRSKQVASIHVDTRERSTIYPTLIPYLHKLRDKDPIGLENSRYGPSYMSTENHTRFKGLPNLRMDTSTRTVGGKEGSGFTHAYNDEPITFYPTDAHDGQRPPWATFRPTGVAIMKTDFRPYQTPHGNEDLPKMSHGSEQNTGFTREPTAKPVFYHPNMDKVYTKLSDIHPNNQERIKKSDPAEFTNMQHPHNASSIAKTSFLGKQRPDLSEAERLGNITLGKKELTGYSENNDRFFETAENIDSLKRFHTNYKLKFYDKNPVGEARLGNTKGNVMRQLPDGFTKSTFVHQFGPDIDSTAQLRNREPYVARSIKATDRFYDDHTHDSKLHSTAVDMRRRSLLVTA